jgi:3,4-dihydroxy 2-butanone 4-phosphate synthase/GTP cyclohydrolase II
MSATMMNGSQRAARPAAGAPEAVEHAARELARGRPVIVTDDPDRENEGDLILAADRVTAESLAFMLRHTSGLVCVGVPGDRLDQLELPQMVHENSDAMGTAFTVSVDLKDGTTTGISAADRAATIRALADPSMTPERFARPGHVFPLRYREGGVLKRAGHTEAAVDLARLAGAEPVGTLCEITNEDGTMARGEQLHSLARTHGLAMISIDDLIAYRRRSERLVERTGEARLPTDHGTFRAIAYRSLIDGDEHVAFVAGEVAGPEPVLVRVHSECLTGDAFGSRRCDCGEQLDLALRAIAAEGRGVLVYLRGHEGRGIGLAHKLRAYELQDEGLDTVDANLALGLAADDREYGVGAQILADLGVQRLRLMTNNPSKYHGLAGYGLEIVERLPLLTTPTPTNAAYLAAKRSRMGHLL